MTLKKAFDRVWHAGLLHTNLMHVVSQILFLTGIKIIYLEEDRELPCLVSTLTGPTLKPGFPRDRSSDH